MLNKQELGTVLRRIGERMSDKELKDMVDEVEINAIITIFTTIIITHVANFLKASTQVDADKSGAIDFDEFVLMMAKR